MVYIRLSCGSMIWLLTPPPLSRQQVVSLSQSSCVAADGRDGAEGVGEDPNHTTTRKAVTL
jgi:hypothetical protein